MGLNTVIILLTCMLDPSCPDMVMQRAKKKGLESAPMRDRKIAGIYFRKRFRISFAAFSPESSMPPKMGPIRKLPNVAFAAMPAI